MNLIDIIKGIPGTWEQWLGTSIILFAIAIVLRIYIYKSYGSKGWTKRERMLIYKTMLLELSRAGEFIGFCNAYYTVLGKLHASHLIRRQSEPINSLVELMRYKPMHNYKHDYYWFSKDEKGTLLRIDILKDILDGNII